jgi:hypothetical protein
MLSTLASFKAVVNGFEHRVLGLETSIIVSFYNLQNRQVKVQISDIDFLSPEKRTNRWDEVIEMIAANSFLLCVPRFLRVSTD